MPEILKKNDQLSAEQEKLSQSFKRIFWDIDVSTLDFEKNYKLIITQVLNYGHVSEIQSLFSVYSKSTIKSVLENPMKGVWSPKTYKAFCNLLNVLPQKNAINILFVEKTRKNINKLFPDILNPQY